MCIVMEGYDIGQSPRRVVLSNVDLHRCRLDLSIIANIIEPYLINPTEGNLKGKTGYFLS